MHRTTGTGTGGETLYVYLTCIGAIGSFQIVHIGLSAICSCLFRACLTHRTRPDAVGHKNRTAPDTAAHGTDQNGPDTHRTYRTWNRTFRTAKPDTYQTLIGH